MILPLYRALTVDQRRAAVESSFQVDPSYRDAVVRRFTKRVGGFRPATVRAWPNRQLANQVVRRELEIEDDAPLLLRTHYVQDEPAIQTRFLELTGVEHDGAYYDPPDPPPNADRDTVLGASRTLSIEFGLDALHYMKCLAAVVPEFWPGINEAIEQFHEIRAELAAKVVGVQEAAEAAPAPEEAPSAPARRPIRMRPPGPGELGILDDTVVVALINSANEIDAAIRPEAAKRLVAELVKVNGQRHQSWYTAGLYRSLFDDTDNDPGPNVAPPARQWFLAGRIVGLVRRNCSHEVVELFDADPACRVLGETGTGPSNEAAPHLFTALWEAGRYADAIGFLTPNAIAHSMRIGSRVYDAGLELLSQRQPAEARAALDLVREALRIREADGHPIGGHVLRQIERRQGHIRRLLGEFEAARALLTPIAASEEEDPEIRSMLITDLALMDAGYRELADLKLPADKPEARQTAKRLEAVRGRLEEALRIDPDGAAHAHYVLGMLELLEERGELAVQSLDRAVAAFRARPDVYTRQGLLANAELHRALAVCLAGGATDSVVRAARMVMESTSDELRVPEWLIESLLVSVGAADEATAEQLFETLVAARGEEIVAPLEGLAGTIQGVAHAFLKRAISGDLSAARRARAARVALQAFLAQDNPDLADEAFGVVVELARRGIERGEALQFLAEEEELTRVRDSDELLWIRAELHAAAGEPGNAISLFRQVAEQQLSKNTPWERAEAAEAVDRMAEFPEADGQTAVLRQRLTRVEEALPAPEFARGTRGVRLLIVGGNEVQARYEPEIREVLKREAPHITPEFMYTGWSSNWGELARTVIQKLEHVDGMVLHYYIRTMFGRKVRAAAPIWCSVAGHGRDGILRGIQRCAEMVEQKRRPDG